MAMFTTITATMQFLLDHHHDTMHIYTHIQLMHTPNVNMGDDAIRPEATETVATATRQTAKTPLNCKSNSIWMTEKCFCVVKFAVCSGTCQLLVNHPDMGKQIKKRKPPPYNGDCNV